MTTLADDHPDKWKYQQHTKAKHQVLTYYLDVWTRIVSDDNYNIRVFDCFAGRGDYIDSKGAEGLTLKNIQTNVDYPGSPLLILDELSNHTHLFNKAECIFLEPEDANREALQQNLDSISELPDEIATTVINEEFRNIDDVINENGGWRGFGFFLIDPFGLKDLEFETVTKLASTSRFDCLITLMTKELIRWKESEHHQDTYEILYGTPSWKEDLQNFEPVHLESAECEFYCHRLENQGVDYTLAYMTTRGDSIELIYDLVFTTNSTKGLEAMKESMMRCGSDYALAYAPERTDIGGPEQATLFGGEMLTEEDTAKSYLVTRFANQKLTFEEVINQTLEDPDRRYADSLRKDYRQYLVELDNNQKVDIPERESEEDPLPDEYQIHF